MTGPSHCSNMSLDLVSIFPLWYWVCHQATSKSSGWHPPRCISRKKSVFIPVIPVWVFELHLFGLAGNTYSSWANLCGQQERPWCLVGSESQVHTSSEQLRVCGQGWGFSQNYMNWGEDRDGCTLNPASANSKGRNMCWAGKNNRCPLHLATAK